MKDLNIPEEEKKISKAIDDMLPDEETTKDLIIKELIKTIETVSNVRGFANSVNASYKFLENEYSNDEEYLEELKKWNESYSSQVGFDNPETFIMLSVLMMAQQSYTPDIFEDFLKSYNNICSIRKLHSFQKE